MRRKANRETIKKKLSPLLVGIFSCSVTGTYLFTYTVNTMTDAYQLVVRLVLDGINESDGTSNPFHDLQVY